jgi:hypothetical protein
MKNLIFACLFGEGESEYEALRLVRSIRTFGGELCFNPIWLLTQMSTDEISASAQQQMDSLGVRLISFEMAEAANSFPFKSYVTAAAIAEGLAQGESSFLAMMATDTLVLQPPLPLLLPAGKSLGACPVHLKLLGININDPIDDFWQLIYQSCKVDMHQVFEMQSTVDAQPLRAYFNSGLLVVRPERGILRKWQSSFDSLYRQPEFEHFYQQDELYQIFMHQAVLAGTILASVKPGELQQLQFEINYPLHLHTRVDEKRRPKNIARLITCRYEDYEEFFANPEIERFIQIDQPLKDWLDAQL